MSVFARRVLAAGLIAGLAAAAPSNTSPPLFSPTPTAGWISYGPEFIPEPSGPQPVTFDPAHPFINNAIEYTSARPELKIPEQNSTFPVADLSNPLLQPWVRDELKKLNDRVLAGRPLYSRQSSCWPMGVPGFLLYVVAPIYILQTPRMVYLITTNDHMVRHVYLNVPHSRAPKPSWYGESIGHYEGEWLVVDTVAISIKAFVDNYRTPHSDALHVVERFHIIEGGKTMEVKVHIEDKGAFTSALDVSQRYARSERDPLREQVCAENNANYFNHEIDPIPQAEKADF